MNRFRCGALIALLAAVAVPALADLELRDAWVRAMPPGSAGTAGYLRLVNAGSVPLVVVGADSDIADSAELHQTLERDGLLSMAPLPRLSLAPGAEVALEPGGRHLMLMGLKAPLQEGGVVEICLHLEQGGRECVEAEVRRGEATGHHHHH